MSAILTFEAYFMINGCIFIKDPNREQKIERFLNPMIKEYEYYGVFWDILQLEVRYINLVLLAFFNMPLNFVLTLYRWSVVESRTTLAGTFHLNLISTFHHRVAVCCGCKILRVHVYIHLKDWDAPWL